MTGETQRDREGGSRESYRVAEASFEAAVGTAGPHDRWYCIAGHLVRLRFAGPSLAAPMTQSLDHLETSPRGDAELTICLWDGASTGIADPPTPEAPAARAVAGEVCVYRDGDLQAVYRPHDRILNWLDSARSLGLYWAPDARTLPFDERVSPLRHILSWWMRRRGLQFVHAAAVGSDDGAVMLVGPERSRQVDHRPGLRPVGSPLSGGQLSAGAERSVLGVRRVSVRDPSPGPSVPLPTAHLASRQSRKRPR